MDRFRTQHYKGFTLIETILSIAVMALLFAVMVPVYQSILNQLRFQQAINAYVTALHRAQMLASSGEYNSPWGVYVESGSLTVFQGNDYATRNSEFDETKTIPETIAISGTNQIVFNQTTGIPVTNGIVLISEPSGNQKQIIINTKGMVNY